MADSNNKKNSTIKAIVLFVLLLVVGVGLGIGAAFLKNKDLFKPATPSDDEPVVVTQATTNPNEIMVDTIDYKGHTYAYNEDITTLLFMGIDTYEDYESYQIMGNGGRADTIIVFIINSATNSINMLEINRDTYTTVQVYDDDRNFLYDGMMQLAMQYTFSDNDTRGCYLMCDKVNNLLYGIPIDYYCSINIDGMSAIITLLGGLEVTFDQDYTYIDPEFALGSTVVINSEQAERFYRYRDTNEHGSNEGRMARQTWLMYQVFDEMTRFSSSELELLLDASDGYVTTNMDIDTIESIRSYALGEAYMTPGNYEAGEFHDEFYFDEEALQDLLIDLFYVEVEE